MLKLLSLILLSLIASLGYAEEITHSAPVPASRNMTMEGLDKAKEGDIIEVSRIGVAVLCDFRQQIVSVKSFQEGDRYQCVYSGKPREGKLSKGLAIIENQKITSTPQKKEEKSLLNKIFKR